MKSVSLSLSYSLIEKVVNTFRSSFADEISETTFVSVTYRLIRQLPVTIHTRRRRRKETQNKNYTEILKLKYFAIYSSQGIK